MKCAQSPPLRIEARTLGGARARRLGGARRGAPGPRSASIVQAGPSQRGARACGSDGGAIARHLLSGAGRRGCGWSRTQGQRLRRRQHSLPGGHGWRQRRRRRRRRRCRRRLLRRVEGRVLGRGGGESGGGGGGGACDAAQHALAGRAGAAGAARARHVLPVRDERAPGVRVSSARHVVQQGGRRAAAQRAGRRVGVGRRRAREPRGDARVVERVGAGQEDGNVRLRPGRRRRRQRRRRGGGGGLAGRRASRAVKGRTRCLHGTAPRRRVRRGRWCTVSRRGPRAASSTAPPRRCACARAQCAAAAAA
jgi:hypothetical protein